MINNIYFRSKAVLLLSGILVFFIQSFSCYDEDDDCTHQPFWKDCYEFEPHEGLVKVTFTINGENPSVVFKLFEGVIEDGDLVLIDTVSTYYHEYSVPIGRYSGSALYLVGIDTIQSIDGDKIETDHEEYCEGDCWHVEDAELNLQLSN